jgi:hypothetical protein
MKQHFDLFSKVGLFCGSSKLAADLNHKNKQHTMASTSSTSTTSTTLPQTQTVASTTSVFDPKTGACLDRRINRALGAVFGACIGDAAGLFYFYSINTFINTQYQTEHLVVSF